MNEVKYFDNIFQVNHKTNYAKFELMETKINEYLKYIKSLNLSQLEEIMLIYNEITSIKYNESSESIPDIIYNKGANDIGYANLFNELLLRLGYKAGAIKCEEDGVAHFHSVVQMQDTKYRIYDIYCFDPYFDSKTGENKFFAQTINEVKASFPNRKYHGIFLSFTEGVEGNYFEMVHEFPIRIMNLINGFFPSLENKEYLNRVYEVLEDVRKWREINYPNVFTIVNLGYRAQLTHPISSKVIDSVNNKVSLIQNSNIYQSFVNTDEEELEQNYQFVKNIIAK